MIRISIDNVVNDTTDVSVVPDGTIQPYMAIQAGYWASLATAQNNAADELLDEIAEMDIDWFADDTTHTGTSVPATPDPESTQLGEQIFCGTGGALRAFPGRDYFAWVKYMDARIIDAEVIQEWRWIEDQAYYPAQNAWRITKSYSSCDGYDSGCSARTAMINIVEAFLPNAITYFPVSEYPTELSVRQYLRDALNPLFLAAGYPGPSGNGHPITIHALWGTIAFWFNDIGSYYGMFPIDANLYSWGGQQGEWHRETKVTYYPSDDTEEDCRRSTFIASYGSNAGIARDQAIRNRAADGGVFSYPIVSNNSIVTIGNLCAGTDHSTFQNPFESTPPTIPGYDVEGADQPNNTVDITYPPISYLLQQGSPLLGYNTVKGAYVFDLLLKKWGKVIQDWDNLIDFNSINSTEVPLIHSKLGMDAAIKSTTDAVNEISIFSTEPEDGFIEYGKLGFFRLGFTNLHEVKALFRVPFTGTVTILGSEDGRIFHVDYAYEENFTDVLQAVLYPNLSARWYVVAISGNYDLTGLEIRATLGGRR